MISKDVYGALLYGAPFKGTASVSKAITFRYDIAIEKVSGTFRYDLAMEKVSGTFRYRIAIEPVSITFRYDIATVPVGVSMRFRYHVGSISPIAGVARGASDGISASDYAGVAAIVGAQHADARRIGGRAVS